jgi:nicotinate-nucleotide--dimethylbenzimidazole phosphoribosyltransferase
LFGRRRAAGAVAPIDQPEAPRDSARETMPPARYNALAVWASQIEADDGAGGSHALPDTDAADAHAASADAGAGAEQEVAQVAAPAPAPAPSPAASDAQGAEAPIEPSPPAAASPDASAAEPDAAALGQEDAPADVSADIRQAEEVAAEEVTAVLSGVLDRLGAAHHRPFSRA